MSASGQKKRSFTVADFFTVFAVVVIMTMVLAPALVKAGETAKRTDCIDSLKKLAFVLSASESAAGDSLIPDAQNPSARDLHPVGPFKLAANAYADVTYRVAENILPAGDAWAYTWTYTWIDACFVPDDYLTIQDALNGCTKSEIIVRDGVYTGYENRDIDFNGKAITLRSEKGPANCIIDCQGNGRGFSFTSGENTSSILDGFTITNGLSDESGPYPFGWGGGIYCSGSSPYIRNCIIKDSQATSSGGGINCYSGGSPLIENSLIIQNSAQWGGGIYANFNSNPSVINTTISGNTSTGGGGMYVNNVSVPFVTDSILANNSAVYGSELEILGSSSLTIAHSDVEGGMSGVFVQSGSTVAVGDGNITANPRFTTGTLGNYYLSQKAAGQSLNSPCLNAGSQYAAATDLDKYTTRIDHVGDAGVVDMGFHYGPVLSKITCELPENESIIDAPPTICWEANGGPHNLYAVDFSLIYGGPWFSTWENLHVQISDTYWEMTPEAWDLIPSASFVYWRVRGADFAAQPPDVVISDEVFWFYKP